MRLKISTKALDDHESRLYGHDASTDTVLVHQDKVGATYTIIKRTKTVTTVEMSAEAIADLLDDGDYQAEFNSEDNDPYGLMWARAITSVRKQIENQ
jgi:hypothetical protein